MNLLCILLTMWEVVDHRPFAQDIVDKLLHKYGSTEVITIEKRAYSITIYNQYGNIFVLTNCCIYYTDRVDIEITKEIMSEIGCICYLHLYHFSHDLPYAGYKYIKNFDIVPKCDLDSYCVYGVYDENSDWVMSFTYSSDHSIDIYMFSSAKEQVRSCIQGIYDIIVSIAKCDILKKQSDPIIEYIKDLFDNEGKFYQSSVKTWRPQFLD